MMTDCVFCNISSGKAASSKVYEDDTVFAFHDIHPRAPVHILIVPKKHYTSLNDLTEADEQLAGHILLTASKIACQQGIAARGYRVIVNTGVEGGQVVQHLHLHLLGGRYITERTI
jgi:histidine triad (HIT) family protein